jgi:hypothetical protein
MVRVMAIEAVPSTPQFTVDLAPSDRISVQAVTCAAGGPTARRDDLCHARASAMMATRLTCTNWYVNRGVNGSVNLRLSVH